MNGFAVLADVLDANRARDGFIEYINGQDDRRRVSFADLHETALGLLGQFQARGLAPGDELIIFTPHNEQFIDAFWACQLGGMVPVPVAVGISDDHRQKLLRIFGGLQRPWLYTDQAQLARIGEFAADAGQAALFDRLRERAVCVEQIVELGAPGLRHPAGPADTALIQFSSGSTSEPRGIVLSHANLLTNVGDIIARSGLTPQDRVLSWMPLTHDMGLIGLHLSMFAAGVSQALMDTRLFGRRPLLWLGEAHRLGATILSSPNFGYKHFLKVYESRGLEDVDLSGVRLLYNGAEPISPALCRRFLDVARGFGLEPRAMYPVYGLAEASLAVTIPAPGREFPTVEVSRRGLATGQPPAPPGSPDDAVELVGCGQPLDHVELRLADDAGQPVGPGAVGRIQIRGGNVTAGYYDPRGELSQPFTADGWLDTGDLGFLRDGDLFICGRAKEIIFVNGENYYPHDLEAVAEQHGVVELGKIAVAAVRPPGAEGDEAVAFILHRGEPGEFVPLAREVRRCIAEHTAVEIAHCVPVRTLPKTTSGKLQRTKLAAAFEAGEFDAARAAVQAAEAAASLPPDAALSEIESALARICAAVITDRRIRVDEDLFDLGIGSLALVQLHERIEEQWPGRLELEDLFELPTLAAIAAHLQSAAPE